MGGVTRVTIYLRKVAYGPEGFACKCGGTRFENGRKVVTIGVNKLARNQYICVKCRESYILVKRPSLGGTVL